MSTGASTGPPTGTAVLRRLNAQAVLDALLDATPGPLTGAQLMAATGLSRPTVHGVGDDLIARGLVVERPARPVGPGRPARVYAAHPTGAHVVGVDIGETRVRAAVADLLGTVLGEAGSTFRSRAVDAAERLATTRRAVGTALAAADVAPNRVRAAALAVPAPVQDGRARALEHYLPGLAALDLRGALTPLIDAPVVVGNDADLAVLAERWAGAVPGARDVVLLLAGERLGAGIWAGGQLLRGAAGAAGGMGFLDLVVGVGGTDGIGRLVRRAAHRPAEEVFAAARRGDRDAHGLLDGVCDRAARALTVLGTLLDPEVLVLGGAVAAAGDVLLPPLRRALDRARHDPSAPRPRLVASALAERGPLLGAVRAALDDLRPRLLDAVPALPRDR